MPPANDLLSDPEIAQAYDDVRSDKSETAWLVLKYASATSDNLKLDKTGTGDIAEMSECLGEDEAAYAYVRVKLGNDEYSERTKFAFIVWAGPSTKVMRKAKMSFQSGEVKQVIRAYAIEIQTSDKKELDIAAVTMKLRKAMGANCESTTSGKVYTTRGTRADFQQTIANNLRTEAEIAEAAIPVRNLRFFFPLSGL